MMTSPPPTSAGDCACSRTMAATPSRMAITATPTPKPAASTALRTGCAVSDRNASRPIIASRSLSIRPSRIVSTRAGAIGERGVVRDDDQCRAVGVDAVEQRRDLLAGRLVELAGGLVGQQQPRPVGERARDRHALHLAARELRRPMVGARRRGRRTRAAPSCAAAVAPASERRPPTAAARRSRRGQHRQQEEALEDEADLPEPQEAAPRIGQSADVLPVEEQRAREVVLHAAEHVQQRGLPAARRSAHRDVIAGCDLKRDVAHGRDRSGRHREDAAHVLRVHDE